MPPRSTRYTLVGFSSELDWRPLVFAEPLQTFRVCSACGLVRKRTAMLPCLHALCEACYEQSAQEGARTCPRDGRRCEEQDVDWKDFPLEELLETEVKCWNEESGCGHVMRAAEIWAHFQRECEHHLTCCPVCSDAVLCKDVCAHLNSGCGTAVTSTGSQLEAGSRFVEETTILASLKEMLESVVEEIETLFGCLCIDAQVQCDRLAGLSHSVNNFAEGMEGQPGQTVGVLEEALEGASNNVDIKKVSECTAEEIRSLMKELRKELAEALKQDHDISKEGIRELVETAEKGKESLLSKLNLLIEVSRNARRSIEDNPSWCSGITSENREMSPRIALATEATEEEAKESTKETLKRAKQSLRVPELNVSCHEFFVRGVNSLSERARKDGFDCYDSERVYLRGYCVTPGVCAMKIADTVALHIGIQLHKGDVDDYVQWPFEQTIKMTAIHPNGHDELALEVRESSNLSFMQRPSESNDPCYYPVLSLNLRSMIFHGYVESDQLQLKWELLP